MTDNWKVIMKQASQVHTGEERVFVRFGCFWG